MGDAKGKAILIDGNSLLYRAFFAMPHFSTLENQPTNAIYGLAMMLLRLLSEEKPDVAIVTFDAKAKTFRHHKFESYKANRKATPDELASQIPIAKEMIQAFNIPIVEVEGFEADDVVGTIARRAAEQGYDVLIVTGDLDALQLVDDNVSVMTTVKGVSETVVYDKHAVEARYGLKPEQLVDFKALKGDPSDNIPGIPGIGEKTAARLIKRFGSIEGIFEHIDEVDEPKLRETLRSMRESIENYRTLARIVTDIPINLDLNACRGVEPDYRALRELFKRLEFRSLLKRFPVEPAQHEFVFPESEKSPRMVIVESKSDLESLLQQIHTRGAMAIRIVGVSPLAGAKVYGASISVEPGMAYYIRFGGHAGLSLHDLKRVLGSDSVTKIGHNLKREYEFCQQAGIELRGPAFDVMLAAYLINSSRNVQQLADVAFDFAGIEVPAKGKEDSTSWGFAGDQEELFCAEADAVMRLYPVLREQLVQDNLESLMAKVEMPLVPILADMELTGIAVDKETLTSLSGRLEERIADVQKEIFELAGDEFNIGSPKQLSRILFDKLQLPSGKKTKTGYATDADTLVALAPAHEIVAKILEYRELTKLKTTYADILPKLINPATGRIHTTLNQAVTTTGRLSSSDPNLQNIPIRSEVGREIRKAFIASPGNVLVSADYSQIELRILAHISQDEELLRAFEVGEDIHTRTATAIFGVSPHEVTAEMRRQAKTVNFAVIYGQTDYGLSRELNIPASVARRYIEEYFEQYPGVRKYIVNTLQSARAKGYVETLMGRRRYLPELNSANRVYREFAERAAVNMPIQGTAADIIKLAMIAVYDRLRAGGYRAKMVLQVHDELLFDVPEEEVSAVVNTVISAMENAYPLDVHVKVECKVGKDWCSVLPISADENEEVHRDIQDG